ncbi:hypothetical protein ACIRFH_00920 [Streptomyces sp. NPDC093586]|uniref:hypothetical protein n=1 Tax=Streptomyces sp. NPDC093586 TaxID=3366042 RepID=UPI0037F408F7
MQELAYRTGVIVGPPLPAAAGQIAAVQKTRRKRLMEAISFRLQPVTRPAVAR